MNMTERTFDTGELKLHVLEGERNGTPLLLLHGATGCADDWQPLQALLEPHWHIFAVDLRGHGRSDRAQGGPSGYHISGFVRDTIALLCALFDQPGVLVGHSWGALTSMLTAAELGRASAEGGAPNPLRAVVAEDPPVMIYRGGPEMAPFMEFFGMMLQLKQSAKTYEEILAALRALNTPSQELAPEEALPFWAQNMYNLDSDFLRAVLAGQEPVRGIDFKTVFTTIDRPMLLMQADMAKMGAFPDQDLALVQSQVPKAQHVYFPDTSHMIHAEKPEAFVHELVKFAGK